MFFGLDLVVKKKVVEGLLGNFAHYKYNMLQNIKLGISAFYEAIRVDFVYKNREEVNKACYPPGDLFAAVEDFLFEEWKKQGVAD